MFIWFASESQGWMILKMNYASGYNEHGRTSFLIPVFHVPFSLNPFETLVLNPKASLNANFFFFNLSWGMCRCHWNAIKYKQAFKGFLPRNGRVSKKTIPHSMAIFSVATHALHLTGFYRLQRKIWELLFFCSDTISNIPLQWKAKTVNTLLIYTLRAIKKKKWHIKCRHLKG